MKNYPSIRAFISYAGTYKKVFWITAACFAISDVIITLVPWLIGQLTTSLQHSGPVAGWTAALIFASVGHDAIWRLSEILYARLLLARGHRFDDFVFAEVISHPYSYFVDKFTGKVSSYATGLGRDYRELMDNFHYNYVNLVVAMPVIAATMFTVNVYTGLIFIVSIAMMFVTGRKLAAAASRAEKVEADRRSTIDGYVVDAIANFVSVKAFGSERREASRLSQKRGALIEAATTAFYKSIWFWGVMSLFIRWIIWPATFILNVYLFQRGRIDIAQMTTFLAVIVLFSSFIWDVIWNISQLNIKLARIEEAYRYLFGQRNIFKDKPPLSTPRHHALDFNKALELRNLSFAYPDQPQTLVLTDINLTIKKGEKVGVVGPSGGGKSTLLKLLLGYYPATSGQLLLDDAAVDSRGLADSIAYVPQDTAVFHRSIRENIAYGQPDATQAEIEAAAKQAQAHNFIVSLQESYDTLVGERGVKLSGGQRQRVAIARAILKDAPLLMLDEATSALDSESEKSIQQALHSLFEQRTAIVIAHRLSTIQNMDRIVVFDQGRIIEEGTHRQLLDHKGVYAKLWAHQSGGFIED
jgi:ATP-binding cassette subfamily B protein